MPAYTKTVWVNGTTPAINATNLNKIEQGIADAVRKDGSEAMSAQLVTIAGSAATPAIAPTGDSNTGIFFPAADTLSLGTAGGERVRINSSGNVGVGITDQSYKLDVAAYTATPLRVQRSGEYGEVLKIGRYGVSDGAGIGYPADNVFSIITNANERMRITSAGNVGIGTTSPSSTLHISSATASYAPSLRITNTGTAIDQQSVIALYTDNSTSNSFLIGKNSVANGADTFLSNQANSAMIFETNGTGRMRITSAGNVGIGTTSPSNKLQVVSSTASTIGITTTTAGSEATPATINLSFYGYNNEERGRIRVLDQSANNYNTKMIFYTSSDPTNTMTERMQLSSSGYLLIGYTSSNGAYPLQVNGQIFATSSTIATSDGRYKKDVVSLDGALDIVKALNPVQFSWKDHPVHKFNTDVPTVGFIAQEVEQALADKSYLTSIIKKSECTWETETGETIEREVTRDVEKQVTREVEREVTETIDGEEVTRTITEEVTETIIEQVTEIVTEPVKETHTEEFLGIAESNLIAILTKAVKELTAKVEALEARI